jgi:hypothetical protein
VLLRIAHDPGARHRGQPGHHREQRPRHRHRPGRSRLPDQAESGRRNCYQIQAHLPLPEPATQEPAIGEVLALPAGAGARLQLTGPGPT